MPKGMTKYQLDHFKTKVKRHFDPLIEEQELLVKQYRTEATNKVVGKLAKKMGAKYSIALSTNKLYGQLLPDRFIDAIVNPETITVSRILHNLRRGHIHSIHSIRDTKVELIEAEVSNDCGIINIPFEDLVLHKNIKILAIYRPDTGKILFPKAHTVIKPKDLVIIKANNVAVKEVEKLFSFSINLF